MLDIRCKRVATWRRRVPAGVAGQLHAGGWEASLSDKITEMDV